MSDSLINHHALAALAVLFVALLMAVLRLRKGPSFADRVLALDLFGTVVISLFLVFCIYSRQSVYLDVAMTLAIMAFMGNTVYGRFIDREEREKSRDR